MKVFLLIILSSTILLFSSSSTARSDTITPTQPLAENETLLSSGGRFSLGFFTPTNSNHRYLGLWYTNISSTVLWVANRQNPLLDPTAGTLSIARSGSLSITSNQDSSVVIWSTAATSLTNPVAQLLDTGNFVVKESDGDATGEQYAWQSFDHPTDTLIPGMKLGVDRITGLNRTLTAWKSDTDPSPGDFYLAMDIGGDPEIYLWSSGSGTRLWRTGPWDGIQFSGVPGSVKHPDFTFTFVNDDREVSYAFNTTDKSVGSRLTVNRTGLVQRSLWLEDAGQWNIFWSAPGDQCDVFGLCGPYALCDPNSSPLCSCLHQGFTRPNDWGLSEYGSDGCDRTTKLNCSIKTDDFTLVSGVKLPATSTAMVNTSLGLDECKSLCLNNCSCTAYATADVNGSHGCIIWVAQLIDLRKIVDAGQDLYVRMAAADLDHESNHKSINAKVAIAVTLGSAVLVLVCVGCFLWKRKKTRKVMLGSMSFFNDPSNEEGPKVDDIELPLFDFGTVAVATGYFSDVNKLGQGGFGPVYKGKLGEHQEIAVKRLAKTSNQGTEEFKNEVLSIAKLQHRNLVRLLGCCIQMEERMLIYEYLPNKSLDAFLFDKQKSALLDWQTRYQIIFGVTRGLLYLHHDSRFRIIHRDLKASNILLDKEMNPKISDFGMARIFGGDETDFNTRKVVGTYGYMSPEYAMDGIFSVKSDVFSFGVLVLEIISGKKNRGVYAVSPHLNLVAHAWSLWKEGKSLEIVDETMNDSYPMNEVLKCINIGLLCVQERPEDRPSMSSVILMLGGDSASLPQPEQPGFAARRGPLETNSSPSKQESFPILDEISLTIPR